MEIALGSNVSRTRCAARARVDKTGDSPDVGVKLCLRARYLTLYFLTPQLCKKRFRI